MAQEHEHIQQPPNSRLCGQYCVAMLAGITPDEAIEVVGKRGGTYTRDVAEGLRALGFKVRTPRKPLRSQPVPKRCLLWAQWVDEAKKLHSHWALHIDGTVYDPALRKPISLGWWRTLYHHRKRLSVVEIVGEGSCVEGAA